MAIIDSAMAAMPIEAIARHLGASPADIPGLWNLPGFPELTTNQLRTVAALEKTMALDRIAATLIS